MSLRIFLVLIILALGGTTAFAQFTNQRQSRPPAIDASERGDPLDLPPGDPMLEARGKMMLRAAEKEHSELIERGDEVARLSAELNKSFQQSGALGDNYAARLSQIEKTVKKIRKSLGGDDEKSEQAQPASLAEALAKLTERAATLHDDLKESTRYTISANSIEDANTILDLIAYIRNSRR